MNQKNANLLAKPVTLAENLMLRTTPRLAFPVKIPRYESFYIKRYLRTVLIGVKRKSEICICR